MTHELTVVNALAVMPVMDIQQAKLRRQAIIDFAKDVMVPAIDYGKIPGTSKDTLLKPGAEKLTSLFGLSPRFEIVEKDLDWTGDKHGNEPFFYFQYKCALWRGDILAGEGLGSCNSWEKKYRYRRASLTCPECGSESIIKGKAEYGGGWICYRKKGGCGYKFLDADERITGQEVGQVPNDNPADLVNTLDKMAQKRALVAATLIAVNASEFFTQDVEDMDLGDIVEGEFMPVKQRPQLKQTYPIGADVVVKGKRDEKPGIVKGYTFAIDGSDLIIITMEGKDYNLSPDKVAAVGGEPAQDDLFPKGDTTYQD